MAFFLANLSGRGDGFADLAHIIVLSVGAVGSR
jgi:hypothetical protein